MANGKFEDLTGRKFEKLTVLHRVASISTAKRKYITMWKCLCECGKEKEVRSYSLLSGNTKSCGCIQKKKASENGKLKLKPDSARERNLVYKAYKRRAKAKKIDFVISYEEFVLLMKKPCVYCGENDSNSYRKRYEQGFLRYNGVDRKDSNLGYTLDNIFTCCAQCNYMKLDYTEKEFFAKIEKIYNNRIKNV